MAFNFNCLGITEELRGLVQYQKDHDNFFKTLGKLPPNSGLASVATRIDFLIKQGHENKCFSDPIKDALIYATWEQGSPL